MSAPSLIDLNLVSTDTLARLFSLAEKLSGEKPSDRDHFRNRRGLTAALVFFEPSTRTRLSFETACHREGLAPILLDGKASSSLEKGETFEDTLFNIAAMNPSLMVVRCGDELDLEAMSKQLKMPLLNAGWGRRGHPTQALLDVAAIRKFRGPLQGQKLLIIGDVRHSRVAASHFELSRKLGYEVALCGPTEFLPTDTSKFRVFTDLRQGLQWATVAMALRVQLERHAEKVNLETYRERYSLSSASLEALDPHALVMHPGPINHGVELQPEVLKDRRSIVMDQVSHGVWIRQAILRMFLEEGFENERR